MIDNVIPLKREPEAAIWRCHCDCVTFKAHTDQTLECARCGDRQATPGGGWVKDAPPTGPVEVREVEKVTTFHKTAAMTLRDLLSENADLAFFLAVRKSGVHTVWGNDIDTQDRLDWLERQFDSCRSMLVKVPRT